MNNDTMLNIFREALERIAGNESSVNAELADGIAISALAHEFETRDASACKHTFRPELTGIAKGTPLESGSS